MSSLPIQRDPAWAAIAGSLDDTVIIPAFSAACPCCKRPIDAESCQEIPLPQGDPRGNVKVLMWCPACVSGYREFHRADGLSRLLTRVDRLGPDETDWIRIKSRFDSARVKALAARNGEG